MPEYRLNLVGNPTGTWTTIVALSRTEAIAKASGGRPKDVRASSCPRVGTERYVITNAGSFQYWDIEDTRFAPIIARLALFGKMQKDDIFRAAAEVHAVEELVNVTGMFYDDAKRQVRIWLATLDSPHYDTIGLHAAE
ncbi:MAG: hypothetical protein JSR83_16510 [Proteobacteria bacterium]|nr:hypothetical protein [Pseudomonadota bacterium]